MLTATASSRFAPVFWTGTHSGVAPCCSSISCCLQSSTPLVISSSSLEIAFSVSFRKQPIEEIVAAVTLWPPRPACEQSADAEAGRPPAAIASTSRQRAAERMPVRRTGDCVTCTAERRDIESPPGIEGEAKLSDRPGPESHFGFPGTASRPGSKVLRREHIADGCDATSPGDRSERAARGPSPISQRFRGRALSLSRPGGYSATFSKQRFDPIQRSSNGWFRQRARRGRSGWARPRRVLQAPRTLAGRAHALVVAEARGLSMSSHTMSSSDGSRDEGAMPQSATPPRSAAAPSPFTPIANYGFLSNCHTGALVAPDGSVDWLCVPRFDSPSVFGALLDRGAGSFRFGPFGINVPSDRIYEPGTNSLVTSWKTSTGWVVVRDALTIGPRRGKDTVTPHTRPPADEDADHTLVRTARCIGGMVEIDLVCEPAFDYGRVPGDWTLSEDEHRAEATGADQTIQLQTGMLLGIEGGRARARHVLHAGETVYCALAWSEDARVPTSAE